MSLWDLEQPPLWAPNAIRTDAGWADPNSGELLVTIGNMPVPRIGVQHGISGKARIQACSVLKEIEGRCNIIGTGVRHDLIGNCRIVGLPITKKKKIRGTCRIACWMPYDRGINPHW